ncbi:hypothetical protein HPB47_010245 [Ixodes persulcatus]|uniref:Uncharacterized protein n=1 Tax=Ixodes persulcatus TaxID=34615 RepID=A0AC60P089_IXOPE|nr:hypothetical protein HPB47_010245 [Ixodes persulcatus]
MSFCAARHCRNVKDDAEAADVVSNEAHQLPASLRPIEVTQHRKSQCTEEGPNPKKGSSWSRSTAGFLPTLHNRRGLGLGAKGVPELLELQGQEKKHLARPTKTNGGGLPA